MLPLDSFVTVCIPSQVFFHILVVQIHFVLLNPRGLTDVCSDTSTTIASYGMVLLPLNSFCSQLIYLPHLKFLSITDLFILSLQFYFSRNSHKYNQIKLENTWPLFLLLFAYFSLLLFSSDPNYAYIRLIHIVKQVLVTPFSSTPFSLLLVFQFQYFYWHIYIYILCVVVLSVLMNPSKAFFISSTVC